MDNSSITYHPAVIEFGDEIVALRRHFHKHPEIGFEEHETGQFILKQLADLNVVVEHPVAQTGIVATIVNGAGPVLALRADMDALPIQETGDLSYKSVNDGRMHACGHDGHMAMLLGAAKALDANRHLWNGIIKFIFQPAEEGGGGAEHMIAAGVLANPNVDAIFGLHLWNYQQFGTVGVQAGPVLASADAFSVIIHGTGGHGAMPQGTVDAVYVAGQFITAVQTLVSRNLNPLHPGVVTIGRIDGGTAFNIIADKVQLDGTARAMEEADRQLIKRRLQELCDGLAASFGATIELDYHDSYPPTVNDAAMSDVGRLAAEKVVGDGVVAPFMTMGGEDMSFYLQKVPGCFIFVGSAKADDEPGSVPHHTSHFNIDEAALLVGASILIHLAELQLPPG